MQYIGINEANMIEQIKEMKARIYPNYFNLIRTNNQLLEFIALMKRNGVKTALASTCPKTKYIQFARLHKAVQFIRLDYHRL